MKVGQFQEVYFLSKEILKIEKKIYDTSRFKIVVKKKIDDKKKEDLERFKEKFCFFSEQRGKGNLIWFHGASVGEIKSIVPILENFENLRACQYGALDPDPSHLAVMRPGQN